MPAKKSARRKSTKTSRADTATAAPRASKKRGPSMKSGEGSRIGTKRSDLRFRAPDGSEWASPFEYRVFSDLQKAGVVVRRTSEADAVKYTSAVKQGRCASCNSCEVVQDRVYTPDLHVDYEGSAPAFMTESGMFHPPGFYLETKGYFPGPKRNLFRTARSQHPELDIRLVASTDHWVTKGKTRLSDWAKRFKIPFVVWKGQVPEEWL